MDNKSLELLEFPLVREILAGFTSFPVSRELALGLQPLSDYDQISLLLRQSAEARELLSFEPGFSIGDVKDVREMAKLAALGKILEPKGLLEIEQTLAAMNQLRGRLKLIAEEFPLLWDITGGIVELKSLEKEIGRCIAASGEVLDHASPELSTVRHKLRNTREQMLRRLEAIMHSPRGRRIVQEPLITEREGRYVIPVRIESQKEIKGVVHDISNTGATAFIEPLATIEMGNALREMVGEEQREVERILRTLSAQVGANQAEIARNTDLVARLDLAVAKARYAQKVKGGEPILTNFGGRDGVLRLVEARHPLLKAKAVPLSVEIGKNFTTLVITGPNTGGKTVALKTVGLLSLMALSGMPIPAAPESTVPLFDGVFADIGDEQSIARTLSTFSWHVGNIVRITANATEKSLVLLDELGTSTDPAEGSALARSILLHFQSRGTMTVATTHFSDLKAFAHANPGFQNASLDFDPVTLAPTYHLTVGIPGGSNALATASRLGLDPEIITRAREMLGRGTEEVESLLASLMQETQTMRALRLEMGKEKETLAQRNAELAKRLVEIKEEERHLLQENRDEIIREVAELHREIRQASADLRKSRTKERVEQAKNTADLVRERLKSGIWEEKAPPAEEPGRIAIGDTVWVKDAQLKGTVLSLSEETEEVEVQAGRLKLKLGLDSIEKMSPAAAPAPAIAPITRQTETRVVSRELDLRGKRADEVEWQVDNYLNAASVANLDEVRIIHGTATGTVRRIVRDFLVGHPLVKSFRSGGWGEGGDGVTMVKL
ncbi:MAG: endonuclease MutS2 [Chloroflexota bacterium]